MIGKVTTGLWSENPANMRAAKEYAKDSCYSVEHVILSLIADVEYLLGERTNFSGREYIALLRKENEALQKQVSSLKKALVKLGLEQE